MLGPGAPAYALSDTERRSRGEIEMHEYLEYVVVAGPVEAYDALSAALRSAKVEILQADDRHLTVAFRTGEAEWGNDPTILVAVLDVGHGLCKFVLVARDGRDGGAVEVTEAPYLLFAEVEQILRQWAADSAARQRGASSTRFRTR